MRILIVEDDTGIASLLKRQFESHNFTVDLAHDGAQGSFMARTEEYNLIILDNVMPEKSGVQVCREIRENGKETPILMLSVQSDTDDKVTLFELGADDYVTKPFYFREVLARARALLRRPKKIAPTIFRLENMEFDVSRGKITRAGFPINLTPKEFSIVEYLLRNKGVVISRSLLLDHIWGNGADPFSKTVEAHMVNIRKKLDDSRFGLPLIHNVSGRGYLIDSYKQEGA